MHRKTAIWFFTCDGCSITAEVVLPYYDSAIKRPEGWKSDIYYTTDRDYNPAKDYCDKCVSEYERKKEIREVFK